jgi:hypothetical protein
MGLLALVLFLVLPAAAASCDTPRTAEEPSRHIAVSYSGRDLLRGEPGEVADGELNTDIPTGSGDERSGRFTSMPTQVRVLAVLTVAMMIAGVPVAMIMMSSRRRAWTGLAVMGTAAVLLSVTEFLALRRLHDMAEFALLIGSEIPYVKGRGLEERIGEAVHTKPGFWLPLTALLIAAALNAVALRRADHQPPNTPEAPEEADPQQAA